MARSGECQCGAVVVAVEGEPLRVGVCHCISCQRRTGAMHSFNAYYNKGQVQIQGRPKSFRREAQEGRTLTNFFCAACGTTLFWEADAFPGQYGIAVGIFADPEFPSPETSSWERSRHHWITLPDAIKSYREGRPIGSTRGS